MQKIGAGAMASVYKAKQLSLDRIVAIKILPKRLSEDPEFVKRFIKEGRAAAKLNHNNIVQAIDVGEFGGFHYFVMEFIDGKTVYDELAIRKVYSEADALNIIAQIARALDHAHAKGFIHRDVKPKNIMITRDGTAKLADMGLAREAGDADAAAAEKGRAYGTPYYISPEQIRGIDDVDGRADVYSLGATLYHMVTGRVPFEGDTPAAIMHRHLKEPIVPPDHINSEISTGLAEVVERAMAKDRSARYSSAADMLLDLERVARGEAPLMARSGVDDKLLADLADGQGEPDSAGGGRHNEPADDRVASPPALIAAVVAEAAVILILIIVLVVR
jgi:serine/threonine-protein kinase